MVMNNRSCMVDAAHIVLEAMEISMGNRNLADRIGHDGSERGFHSEELADALQDFDIYLSKRELYPCLQLPGGKIVPIFDKEKAVDRFEKILEQAEYGILICRSREGIHHACAFLMGRVFNTDMTELQLVDLDIVMLMEFICI